MNCFKNILLIFGILLEITLSAVVTKSQVEVTSGDTLTLYCPLYVTNNSVILWSRDDRILFAGSLKIKNDDRYQLINDNLIIRQANINDAGNIMCQVEDEDRKLSKFVYNVIVLEPAGADIRVGSYLAVKKGTQLALNCVGSGVPVPELIWRKGSRILSRGTGEAGLMLKYVTREDGGEILCEASNGVGETAVDTLVIDVLYAPEIEMIQPHLSFQPKCGLELQCVIHSSSPPKVQWMHNDQLLQPQDGVTIWSLDNLHVLQVSSCDNSVQGTYTCVAENILGTAETSKDVTKDWLKNEYNSFLDRDIMINNVRRNALSDEDLGLKSSSNSISSILSLSLTVCIIFQMFL